MKGKIYKTAALLTALSIGAAFGMTACGGGTSREEQKYLVSGSLLTVKDEGTVIYEAEEVDTSAYEISAENPSKTVERADASGGKFLAAAADNSAAGSGYFSFTLNLQFNAVIIMSAAYSQTEAGKVNDIDMSRSYTYLIDENKSVGVSGNNGVLSARDDITEWQLIEYESYTLPKGAHTFRVFVKENTGRGNPNIDYFNFYIVKISEAPQGGVSVPENDFHTPVQYAYLKDDFKNIAEYARGVVELSRPSAIVLDFSYLKKAGSYSVEYADNDGFNNSTVVSGITERQYGVYNLKLGQQLYWRAATDSAGLKKATVNHIQVASDGPRNLYIDGLTNVRDIGGYPSSLVEGGKIRQGLFIRGAALVDVNLNSGEEKARLITESGERELKRLGIKEEIDLRDTKQCTGPYVDGIHYNAISIPSGTESTRFEQFADEYRQIFSIIADADKKPVYLHCTAGADRTGITAFMLLTVCGVSYDDAARDYLFTNFSTHGERKLNSEFDKWYSKLEKYQGDSKAEKAKSWLISKGVTAEQVEHIREIFVENYTAQ